MKKNKRLIAKIFDGENEILTVDENLLSAELGALDRGNLTDVVDWGIYANKGSLSFVDSSGLFNASNVNSSKVKNATVKFYLARETSLPVSTFKIENVLFNEETRQVDISLISNLLSWQTKQTQSAIFPFYETTFSGLLDTINSELDNINIQLGDDTDTINKVSIYCPYFEKDNWWNIVNKICQATMCRIIEDENGNPKITGSFPNRQNIIVNPNNIIDISEAEFVQIANASISSTKREKIENEVTKETTASFVIDWRGAATVSGNATPNLITYPNLDIIGGGFAHLTTTYKIASASVRSQNVTIGESTSADDPTDKDIIMNLLGVGYISVPLGGSEITLNYDFVAKKRYYREGEIVPYKQEFVKKATIEVEVDAFFDDSEETINKTSDESKPTTVIQSNDLIQTKNYYDADVPWELTHTDRILNEVYLRYHKGIECLTMECLFNDYYDEQGNLILDGSYLEHFKQYDTIVPYVIKKGNRVPLRTDENGNAKVFRIIGIEYVYDGLLRQKLHLHEETYVD